MSIYMSHVSVIPDLQSKSLHLTLVVLSTKLSFVRNSAEKRCLVVTNAKPHALMTVSAFPAQRRKKDQEVTLRL